jgi:hypothetical protein
MPRGNPNWIRAAEERRTALARREEAEESQRQTDAVAMVIAPLVGALAGALGVVIAAQKLGLDRERAGMGVAAVGLAIAAGSTGWVRGAAVGVAAAGASVAIAQRFAPKADAKGDPSARSGDAVGITREELQETLTEFGDRQMRDAGVATDAQSRDGDQSTNGAVATAAKTATSNVPAARGASAQNAPILMRFRQVASRLGDVERVRFLRVDVLPHASPHAR